MVMDKKISAGFIGRKPVLILSAFLILFILLFYRNILPEKPMDIAIRWFDSNYEYANCRTYETGFDVTDDKFARLSELCTAVSKATHAFQYNHCKSCDNKPIVCVQTAYPIVFTDEKTILAVFKPPNEGFRLDNIDKGSFLYCSKV